MNHRKIIAILLALALSLSIAPTASANVVEGLSTTFNAPTVTSEMAIADTSNDSDHPLPDIVNVDKINVRITNIKNIQVNPYGMSIASPDDPTQKSSDSIVTAPIFIENRTGTQVEVTATATATPEGDVALDSNPTRYVYNPGPLDNPALRPKEERVYLYLQLTDQVNVDEADDTKKPVWLTKDDGAEIKEVITKEGGSAPLTVTMKKGTEQAPAYAALQIFGNTSFPSYYGSWHEGNGFKVNLVLSFMPKLEEEDGYTVRFDAVDYLWKQFPTVELALGAKILVEGHDLDPFPAGYLSNGTPLDSMVIHPAMENLTFTIWTADEPKGRFYDITSVLLIRVDKSGNKSEEYLYTRKRGESHLSQKTFTINAAEVSPNEDLTIRVILTDVTV